MIHGVLSTLAFIHKIPLAPRNYSLCTGDPYVCTLYGAVDFLNVLKKYIMYL
jgi:hypothetical protein